MSTDKIPVPLQAISGVPVPAVASGVYFLVSTISSSRGSDPQAQGDPSRGAVLLLVAVTILIIGSFLQYRYVRRSMQGGLMDSAASQSPRDHGRRYGWSRPHHERGWCH